VPILDQYFVDLMDKSGSGLPNLSDLLDGPPIIWLERKQRDTIGFRVCLTIFSENKNFDVVDYNNLAHEKLKDHIDRVGIKIYPITVDPMP
jgi:hypothetical protein